MQSSEPLSFYLSRGKEALKFYVLNVGQGLMILIVFPDQTTMLYDCNVTNDNEEDIICSLSEFIPKRIDSDREEKQWIDIFVNSHRDIDHYRGLKKVNEKFLIKSIWDSGQTGATTQDDDYKYYMSLRIRLKNKYGEDALYVPQPSTIPKCIGDAKIYILSSSLECVKETVAIFEKAKIQHTNSIVLSIHYKNRSLLLTGDSDWKAWKEEIVPVFKETGILSSTVLVASHHGSRSFFTDENVNHTIDYAENPGNTYVKSIDYIKPDITLISCGKYEQQHHPNEKAVGIYKKNTSNEQVYTTLQKGTLCGFIDCEGTWTVCPSRFLSASNNRNMSFDLECTYEDKKGCSEKIKSGANIAIGGELKFKITSQNGILDPIKKVQVYWEVSNGGISKDHAHQEIYFKRENELFSKISFSRDLVFVGKHLLRCQVYNSEKNTLITRIFEVNGV